MMREIIPGATCEHCEALEPEVAVRNQPVMILGRMLMIRGVFCRTCATALGKTENWVIRGSRMTFRPPEESEVEWS